MPIRSSEIGIFKVSPVNSIWQSLGNVMKCHIPLTSPPRKKNKKQPKHSRIRTSKIMKWYEMSILQKHSFLKKITWKHVLESEVRIKQINCCIVGNGWQVWFKHLGSQPVINVAGSLEHLHDCLPSNVTTPVPWFGLLCCRQTYIDSHILTLILLPQTRLDK